MSLVFEPLLKMDGVEISNSGTCKTISNFKYSRKKLTLNRKQLHVHFYDDETKLALVSPIEEKELLLDNIHTFNMPSPFNKYVYPTPLYALQFEDDKLKSISAEDFVSLSGTMKAESQRLARLQMAVYDVLPMNEEDDDEEEIWEEELADENSEDDENDEEDSQDDLDFEEDDAPAE